MAAGILPHVGAALIGFGGQALRYATNFWELTIFGTDGTNGVVSNFLTQNPSTFTKAWLLVSQGSIWAIAEEIGAALLVFYFFAGWIKNSLDVRADFTMENIFKMIIRVMLVAGLIMNCLPLIRSFLSLGTAITSQISVNYTSMSLGIEEKYSQENASSGKKVKAKDISYDDDGFKSYYSDYIAKNPEQYGISMKDVRAMYAESLNKIKGGTFEDYGYYVEVYNKLSHDGGDFSDAYSGKKTNSFKWLMTGIACAAAGIFGTALILQSAFKLILMCCSRVFKVLICIPFAPAAFASFAGGPTFEDRGRRWIQGFIGYLLEAVVIMLSISIAGTLFSYYTVFSTDGSSFTSAADVLLNTIKMMVPILTCVKCAEGADQIVRNAMGI